MTVSTTVRRVLGSSWATFSGLPIDVPFSNARVSAGFDQPVTTAQFTVPYLTSRLLLGNPINMFIGAAQVGQPVQQSNSFAGYITGYQPLYYPRGMIVLCEGPLTYAAHYKPDTDVDFTGFTDITASTACLVQCGLDASRLVIGGLGITLGADSQGSQDQRAVWKKGQTGLDFILSLDQICLGFRTFDWGGSGLVFRRIISGQTFVDPSFTFDEHVHIVDGGGQWSLDRGAVGVEVQGANGPSGSQIIAGGSRTGPGTGFLTIGSDLISSQSVADDVKNWGVKELGKSVATLQFTTYRNDDVRPGQTIYLNSIVRLRLARRVWVQNVVRELNETGQFQQTISVISEIVVDDTTDGTTPTLPGGEAANIGTTQPSPTGPDVASAPYDALPNPVADFLFEFIDHEKDDLGNEFWIVICRSVAYSNQGTISTYAWTTDTTTVPDTGSEALFSFKTTDIATQVTLTVTDSAGKTDAITKPCNGPEATQVTRDRHLYAASGSTLAIAYDGAGNWNTQSVSTGVVGNGPLWADGANVRISMDDLATAPGGAVVFASQNVSAVWCETDVSAFQIVCGGDAGGVARSTDGGGTFTEMTSPSANEILRIIASRYNPGEILVLDSAGDVYQSLDFAATWHLIKSHPGAVDLALSNFRNWVGGSFGVAIMEDPTQLATWPGATPNIVAISAHIKDDVVYALADDGSTFYTSPSGGLAMVAGAALPSGTATVRGLMRDGAGVDLLYIAAASEILKSWDGLRTSSGYAVIYNNAAVSVGYGDFPLSFGGGSGVASIFVHGSWKGLIGGVTWTDLGTESPGGELGSGAVNSSATDADNLKIVAIDQTTPPTYRVYTSADGGNTWSLDTEAAFAAGQAIDALFLGFRDGAYRVFLGENTDGSDGGTIGGEYSSADGSSWSKTGRANSYIFPALNATANADGFCATSAHAYYMRRTNPTGTVHRLFCDDNSDAVAAVIRIVRIGTISGGTMDITYAGQTASGIAYNAAAATILSDLQALSTWGASNGAVSGDVPTGTIDFTLPQAGDPSNIGAALSIDGSGLTGGGYLCYQVTYVRAGTISGGTFKFLEVGGDETNAIAWNATAATMLTELQGTIHWPDTQGAVSGDIPGGTVTISVPLTAIVPSITANSLTGGGTFTGPNQQTDGSDGGLDLDIDSFSPSNNLAGAITADVAMIFGQATGSVPVMYRLVGTATPVDVSPSGVMTASDEIFLAVSRDGDTWVCSCYIDASGGNNLIVSHDQGATWSIANLGGADLSDGVFDIVADPITAGTWWMISRHGGFSGQLFRSTDDGDTWAQVGDDTFFNDPSHVVPIGGISR